MHSINAKSKMSTFKKYIACSYLPQPWRTVARMLPLCISLCIAVTVLAVSLQKCQSKTEAVQIPAQVQIGFLTIQTASHSTEIKSLNGSILRGQILVDYNKAIQNFEGNGTYKMFDWGEVKLQIQKAPSGKEKCLSISWRSKQCFINQVLKDCFDISNANWYGGFENFTQTWPLSGKLDTTAFVTNDALRTKLPGGVQERYFISSKGIGIFVEEDVPLFVSFNESSDQRLCLISKCDKRTMEVPFLKYYICKADNILDIHNYMSDLFIPSPSGIPNEDMFKFPAWSTFAIYGTDINQTSVMSFARNIKRFNFSHSKLEIGDGWTEKYGDFIFNSEKFPDGKGMVNDLKTQGFTVTVWMHPFCNLDANNFQILNDGGYFIRQYDSNFTALTRWWDGNITSLIDLSNYDAVENFQSELKRLKATYDIDSFFFESGETNWLPSYFTSYSTYKNPSGYSRDWANLSFLTDQQTKLQETRIGWRTQSLPIFVRTIDKYPTWDYENGIKSLIPTVLTYGIIGYPFMVTRLIGSNGLPSKELFIRWVEATTFFPSIHFSYAPWQYKDNEVTRIVKKFVTLHEQYHKKFKLLANDAVIKGEPIIRALWWLDQDDPDAETIDSEFLVGTEILVAPILDEEATARDIYLPKGKWEDVLREGEQFIYGPKWLRNYAVAIDELAYFKKH